MAAVNRGLLAILLLNACVTGAMVLAALAALLYGPLALGLTVLVAGLAALAATEVS